MARIRFNVWWLRSWIFPMFSIPPPPPSPQSTLSLDSYDDDRTLTWEAPDIDDVESTTSMDIDQ